MTLLQILQNHARERAELVATQSSRHRLTTWRKLWSRVERGSARLEGEWLVQAGDVVAYCGNGHADALVLWLSLMRLGARMLPLESSELQARAADAVSQRGVVVLLHDDELEPPVVEQTCACLPLSTLISRPCKHQAAIVPDDPDRACLDWLDVPHAGIETWSLRQLLETPVPSGGDGLFAPAHLQSTVLPALLQGRSLHLA